jgi:hypothetical protein
MEDMKKRQLDDASIALKKQWSTKGVYTAEKKACN